MSPLRYFNLTVLGDVQPPASGQNDVLIYVLCGFGLIILIVFSAFFSSSEMAFSSINLVRLRGYVEEKRRGSRQALWIAEHFDRTLSTILVGNNFVNIGATTIAAFVFGKLIKDPTWSSIINTVVMTIIVLIFGEIIPKSFAKENSEKFALRFSGLLYFVIKIMYPFVIVFIWLKHLFIRKRNDEIQPTVTESELESIIDTMEEEGVIDSEDADLIQSVLEISDRMVYDIMIPRVDIIGIDIEMSIDEIRDIFFDYKFSRLPVYREDKDHIIGILSERDFLTALITKQEINILELVKKPIYVSKTMRVDDLIRKMQFEKKHLAIVSDEYGGTSGIVTMEDALEELVGEIYDEHDENVIDQDIVKNSDGSYNISAELPIEELFEILELGKAPESSYTNVGGFLYELSEAVPTEGTVLEYQTIVYRDADDDGLMDEINLTLKFTILSVIERRIINVKLEILDSKKDINEMTSNIE